jgi:hypothetical protein
LLPKKTLQINARTCNKPRQNKIQGFIDQ